MLLMEDVFFCDRVLAGESDRRADFHCWQLRPPFNTPNKLGEKKRVQAFGHCQTPHLVIACVTDGMEACEVAI